MSFPSDVKLPVNAKYLGFIDPKKAYNTNWDITWSFTYSLLGQQHAFSTFLSTSSTQVSGIPGHYLNQPDSGGQFLTIAFDSTGLFAYPTLSSGRNGVALSAIIPNSLIIRNKANDILYNGALSALSTKFTLSSAVDYYQALRFRVANGYTKLIIDFKTDGNYINLLTLPISGYTPNSTDVVYPGFSYTSPVSSSVISPSVFRLKNFHTQGNTIAPTYETLSFTPLTSALITSFTTISGISANPK